jgi:hypothetical protein
MPKDLQEFINDQLSSLGAPSNALQAADEAPLPAKQAGETERDYLETCQKLEQLV